LRRPCRASSSDHVYHLATWAWSSEGDMSSRETAPPRKMSMNLRLCACSWPTALSGSCSTRHGSVSVKRAQPIRKLLTIVARKGSSRAHVGQLVLVDPPDLGRLPVGACRQREPGEALECHHERITTAITKTRHGWRSMSSASAKSIRRWPRAREAPCFRGESRRSERAARGRRSVRCREARSTGRLEAGRG
jgi:hypothetical protein